jgi:tight adherence protein B
MDNATIITVASTLLVLVVTGLIAFIVNNNKGSHKKRVMSVIRGEDIFDLKRDSGGDARREALSKKLKETSDAEKKQKKGATLPTLIMQAGLGISVKQYWFFSLISATGLSGLMFALGKGPFVILMAVIIGFFGLPRFVLRRLILSRQKKFLADLADVFESMVRLLKAGMPVSEAIRMVSREFTGPIGDEMGRVFDQQKIGVPLAEAVQSCAARMPLTEVQMFATAVTIQSQTGSSLSEVFENLARTVRSRYRLKRKVKALSSEAKSSAMIIGALPIFVALAMYFINPDYIGLLFTTSTGKFLLSLAVFWMGCGILMMRQMINFKV